MHGGTTTIYIPHLADEYRIHTMPRLEDHYSIDDKDSQELGSLNLEDAPAEDCFDRCSTSASLFEGSTFKDPNERFHVQGLSPTADNAVQGEISAIHDQRAEAYCKELYDEL